MTQSHNGRTVAVVVAHPDDETLWAGGTILLHPGWRCRIVGVCRASDAERAPRFRAALTHYCAEGGLADLDDGPEQWPLPPVEVERAVADWLGARTWDLVITHSPHGEYTRHRRHEEVGAAVLALWARGVLATEELWLFAYADHGGAAPPRARPKAPIQVSLPSDIVAAKTAIVRDIYGFGPETWEARSIPEVEAFWRLIDPRDIAPLLGRLEEIREGTGTL